jgi:hypothetical protein
MTNSSKNRWKTIIDREKLMEHNAEGCPACGRKFTLGDPVVYACGDWEGPQKLIHEKEAVFDKASETYIERSCYEAGKNRL